MFKKSIIEDRIQKVTHGIAKRSLSSVKQVGECQLSIIYTANIIAFPLLCGDILHQTTHAVIVLVGDTKT